MPRLSLWSATQGNNYKFFDKNIREMFTVGGTDLYIHKYLGTNNPQSNDATLPTYDILSPTNIQDLLFLENRDRKYDSSIYRLRGHYNVQNLDFDLSQFGLFLTNDIIFITVHYNDMLDIIGRKLMVGDVFELPHLEDFHPLDKTIPVGLRRYYQITDANWASEGFSPTWYPHLWRIKCEPLVDSQEFQDILTQPINKDNYTGDWNSTTTYQPGYTVTYGGKIYTPVRPVPAGIAPPNPEYWAVSEEKSLIDITSTYNKNLAINQAVLTEAQRMLPLSGYDNTSLYIVPTLENNEPAPPINLVAPLELNTCCGQVEIVNNSQYKFSSAVFRINSNNVGELNPFSIVNLQLGYIPPTVTETGSGPVYPTCALTISVVSADGTVTGPYGTADNTYSFADQYVATVATAVGIPINTSVIPILEPLLNNITATLVVTAVVYSENGTPNPVFPAGTTIVAIDRALGTFTVSNPTLASVPSGTPLVVSYNFDAVVTQQMDYRADADPNFKFIKRASPRNFGYTAGYLTGTDYAPNGLPFNSGTSFPADPKVGDYFFRIDYVPSKLYRYDGNIWVWIGSNVRTPTGLTGDDLSPISRIINNTDVVQTPQGAIPSRQGPSEVFRIKPRAD